MSSDGSVSSRISQFGLYRTIDARTEEFLKLSKKRQIKQGCVCAAISTALTVIVVVAILLIYEYNVIAEARRTSHKANWLGLMNNSADDSKLLQILNQEKIDIDRTTLKLLPILLKALSQNRYLEKIIEEPTSHYTPYEKEVTTDSAITKNIFSDTRNWMKTPHQRLYTIEYKTSPIIYLKNPTRNIDYFTKIRKIRDYQRILNYVDKMISEKNYLGTTQPMKRDYGHTEKTIKMASPTQKHKSTQKIIHKQNTSLRTTTNENNNNCKCSHKLSEVMNKLMTSIQQLLSYFSGSNSKRTVWCNNNKPIQATTQKSLNEKPLTKNTQKMITENFNFIEPKLSKPSPYKAFLNRHKYNVDFTPTKIFHLRKDHTVNAIMNLIKPNFSKYNEFAINFESNEVLSTTNNYLKSSQTNILNESTGKSFPNHIDSANIQTTTKPITTLADYILQKGNYDNSSPDTRSSLSSFPETDFSDVDDYAVATEMTTNSANNFNSLDTYSLELIKSKLIPERHNIFKDDKMFSMKGVRIKNNLYHNIASMRKMGKLVSRKIGKDLFFPSRRSFTPFIKLSLKSTTPQPHTTRSSKVKSSITKPTEKTSTNKYELKIKHIITKNTKLDKNPTNNVTTVSETDHLLNENVSKETTLKHIEDAIMILNNETTNQVENYSKTSADTSQWKTVKLEEKDTTTKSMIPLGRSTYLEMQRNNWNRDENHDFDNDMNYIFD